MNRKLHFLALSFFCIASILTIIYIFEMKYSDKIFPGIYIDDLYVGGLTLKEAKEQLKLYVNKFLDKPLTLNYEEETWYINPKNLLEVKIEEIVKKAYTEGRTKNFLFNFFNLYKLNLYPKRIELATKIREEEFQMMIEMISKEVERAPKNAEFKIAGGKIAIEKEKEGIKVDKENLKKEIMKFIWSHNRIIKIPLTIIKPDITKETLEKMDIKEEIASFSTKFDKTQIERTTNIILAAEKLRNYIIPPGEVFSFNEVVGERTSKEGYKEAPIFLQNEITLGTGGGVCQLSTTLYNLALLANLEIVERSNHSLPVSYVPLGRDATVNYGIIDLKFKNTSGCYLLLYTEVEGDTITMKFFGSKKSDKKIEIVPEILKEFPPPVNIKEDYNLEKGKIKIIEGKPGYQVRVWKIILHNDGTREKELISIDEYNPTATILYVGKKETRALQNIKDATL